jgi:NAD(P)-dependent dehydrogenase (short-subunit alcohol dehydrogenase family)
MGTVPPGSSPVAFITGAGSGIGLAIASQLARVGYSLALVGRRRELLEEAARSLAIADRAMVLPADVGNIAAIGEAVQRCAGHFGRLDVLVNNAGHAPLLPIEQSTPENLDECFRINAIGPAYAIARAWPIFKRQRKGCVVNVSTMATADPFPGFSLYAAAKAGVNLLAKSCAKEGREFGIRAFSVAPGAVETPLLRSVFNESQIPTSKCLSPDEVARVVVECITGARDSMNGETIFVPSP